MKATPKQWLERCKASLLQFEQDRRGMTLQQQREVLNNHYEALTVIKKIVGRKAVLLGTDHRKLGEQDGSRSP